MKLEKETEDIRGKILWLFSDNREKEIHIVEIKKGFARGGHSHPFDSIHVVTAGRVLYKEYDIKNSKEDSRSVEPVTIINTPKEIAHLMIAEEDSIFVEVFDRKYEAADFPPYRKIVEERMKAKLGT